MATIKQIAKLAGVSTATVSNVINGTGMVGDETRNNVMKIVKELNYEPNSIAKSLKIRKTNTIGVITEDITVFSTNGIVNGIDEYLEKQNYSILLNNIRLYQKIGNNFMDTNKCSKEIVDITRDMLRRQVDGLIYIGFHNRDISGMIEAVGVPIVYTYCFSNEENACSIIYDDEKAAYEVIMYFIQNGHTRISLISGPYDSMHSQERYKGYQRAIFENNILFNPSYIKVGDWTYSSGYRIGRELLELPNRPTAVFAMNDEMAYGFNDAARSLGLSVPEDVSLIGFDDRYLSEFYRPRLTSVALPLNQMGQKAAEAILNIIKNDKNILKSEIIKMDCKIAERDSVRVI